MKIERTFNKAMDQIDSLQKVFRDDGLLAKAVVDIGGNQDFGDIQEAFDNLYGALEDGIYDAVAHIEVESVKQKLGMNEENKTIIPQGQRSVIVLAGDSIWDREGENPTDVYVSRITIENPYEPGGYMDDDEDDGYRKVDVEHNGPWTIYTDSGFAKAISDLVGFEVDFTEQGMQNDGMASMEGTMGDAMESVNVTEGYEGKVLGILKKEGIGAYFSGGKLYIDQADMSEAKSVLSDNDEIKELPDMVAETLHEGDCGCDACSDKIQKMSADDELQILLKRAGLR